jgi:hypothetical protein
MMTLVGAMREALGSFIPAEGISSEGARSHLAKVDAIIITIIDRCTAWPTIEGLK